MLLRKKRHRSLAALASAACLLVGCVDHRLRRELARADRGLLASPAMHLVLCGTGSTIPDRSRAGSCSALAAAGQVLLVDVGPGAWEGAHFAGLPADRVDGVFLTTLLIENVADLGEVLIGSWIAGRPRPLPVYGPVGTARVVEHFVGAHGRDVAMRTSRHDRAVLDPRLAGADVREIALDGERDSAVVHEQDGLRVTAFLLDTVGGVPVLGYRFEHGGRAVVIGGHARAGAALARFAAGCDVLVHEAAHPAMIQRAIRVMEELDETRLASFAAEMLRNHASPVEVARTARAAGVGRLVFSRVYPPLDDPLMRWAFLRDVHAVFPAAVIGEDAMRFRLDPKAPPSR